MPLWRALLASVFLLAAGIPPAFASSAQALSPQEAAPYPETVRNILVLNDPVEASYFLNNDGMRADLERSNPELFNRVLVRASELVDLEQVLRDHMHADGMRQGLLPRQSFYLLQKPERMMRWVTHQAFKHASSSYRDAVRQALWDWGTLNSEQTLWLENKGHSARKWGAMSFGERHWIIREWVGKQADEFLSANPKTPGEIQALSERLNEIRPFLSREQMDQVYFRFDEFTQAVEGLQKARRLLGQSRYAKNPELRSLLANATTAGDPAKTLDFLGRFFDGAGVKNTLLDINRPSRPEENLSEADKKALAGKLAEDYLREISKTPTGIRIAEFYKTHKLNLVVRDIENGTLAYYSDDEHEVAINANLVEEYLRTSGNTTKMLLGLPEVRRKLVLLSLPSFVHEATHQQQYAWSESKGLPHWYGQHDEVEAKGVEALFVLEKMQADASYKKFLTESSKSNSFARASLGIANRLREDPDLFDWHVRRGYYPSTPSYKSRVSYLFADDSDERGALKTTEAELQRRAKLSPEERAREEETRVNFKPKRWYAGVEEWRESLKDWPTAMLREINDSRKHWLLERKRDRRRVNRIFTAYRDRDDSVRTRIENGLIGLGLMKPRRDRLRRVDVPSPAGLTPTSLTGTKAGPKWALPKLKVAPPPAPAARRDQ